MVVEAFEKNISKSEGFGIAILENERIEETIETQTQEFLFPGQAFYGNNRNFNTNVKDSFELKPRPLGLRMVSKTYKLGLLMIILIPIDGTEQEFSGPTDDCLDMNDLMNQSAGLSDHSSSPVKNGGNWKVLCVLYVLG